MLLAYGSLPAGPDSLATALLEIGAASVLLSLIGFLRWVFVAPRLASEYTAQQQFGGALLGEHLAQLPAVGGRLPVAGCRLPVALSLTILRTRVLPHWLGSVYLLNQGDILATIVPGSRCGIRQALSAAPDGDCAWLRSACAYCAVRPGQPVT